MCKDFCLYALCFKLIATSVHLAATTAFKNSPKNFSNNWQKKIFLFFYLYKKESHVMLRVSNNYFSVSASKYNNSSVYTTTPKIKSLNKDTISFGYINAGPVPKDIQLYRAIGYGEYKKLLEGKCIEGHSYTTSDPRGWIAKGWNLAYGDWNSDNYFVTFKTNRNLDIMDRRDSLEDTRYSIGDYTLDDVKEIRKGNNVHGELLYAPNFEEAKAEDLKKKESEIQRLTKIIKSQIQPSLQEKFRSVFRKTDNTNTKKEMLYNAYDELGSYCKEFPEIIDSMMSIAQQKDSHIYNVISMVYYANREQDLSYVRKYLNDCLDNNKVINNKAVEYMKKQGKNEDMPLLMRMFAEGADKPSISRHTVVDAIKKAASSKEDYDMLKNTFKNSDIISQYYLMPFFEDTDDYTTLSRFILDKYKNESQKEMFKDYKIEGLMSACIKELKQHGSLEDIEYIEPYAKENLVYVNEEAQKAIATLENKYSK